jgi:hypothetical protein
VTLALARRKQQAHGCLGCGYAATLWVNSFRRGNDGSARWARASPLAF